MTDSDLHELEDAIRDVLRVRAEMVTTHSVLVPTGHARHSRYRVLAAAVAAAVAAIVLGGTILVTVNSGDPSSVATSSDTTVTTASIPADLAVVRSWRVSDSAGQVYLVEQLRTVDTPEEAGFRLISNDRVLLVVWNDVDCVGGPSQGGVSNVVPGGYELIGSLPLGATGVELTMPDGTVITEPAIGSDELPVPFYVASTPSEPTDVRPLGIDSPASCP